jgi:PPK2 family polyphosphate:nucleotide phosphotransferase
MTFSERFRVKPGAKVRLASIRTDATPGVRDEAEADELLEENRRALEHWQSVLWAEDRRSLLIVLQGMDGSGKDGTIRAVMRGVNPQGCRVTPFKAPSGEELDHDFLWRIHRAVPPKGEIAIFNRSHYEDVLAARVRGIVTREVWETRYEQINAFERILTLGGTTVLKFFLHISKSEQRERLAKRLADPDKHWKVQESDFEDRKRWSDYWRAYEDALRECSTRRCPWFVIPADNKWYRDAAVSSIIVETLKDMDLRMPRPTIEPRRFLFEDGTTFDGTRPGAARSARGAKRGRA